MSNPWQAIRQALRRRSGSAGRYTGLEIDSAAIARGDYKQHLGGGSESWEQRGLFQLRLLQSRGLSPGSTLLDIGCGPMRAGAHFVRYLEAGRYVGFDYNASFVEAARFVIAEQGLADKSPAVLRLQDFDFRSLNRRFDFAIAFSVLNHCDHVQRELFLRNIRDGLAPGAQLYVSHAGWMNEAHLALAGLRIRHNFDAAELKLEENGWDSREEVLPLYELAPA
jgi:SAM-dependent methyltransferase